MDADEWVNETRATEALAELFDGHRAESLREVCVFADSHFVRSGKDVCVDSGVAAGDFDGSAVFFIKLAWSNAADDAVGVADIAEVFEGFEKECFAETGSACGFDDAGGAEEGAVGGFTA